MYNAHKKSVFSEHFQYLLSFPRLSEPKVYIFIQKKRTKFNHYLKFKPINTHSDTRSVTKHVILVFPINYTHFSA